MMNWVWRLSSLVLMFAGANALAEETIPSRTTRPLSAIDVLPPQPKGDLPADDGGQIFSTTHENRRLLDSHALVFWAPAWPCSCFSPSIIVGDASTSKRLADAHFFHAARQK